MTRRVVRVTPEFFVLLGVLLPAERAPTARRAPAGVLTLVDATVAGHFIQEIRRDAAGLVTGLLLAVAVKQAGLAQVGTWLTAVSSVETPENSSLEPGLPSSRRRWMAAHSTRSRSVKASTPPLVQPQPVSAAARSRLAQSQASSVPAATARPRQEAPSGS